MTPGNHGRTGDKRKPDYDRSERRIGVTKEVWYLAHTPAGDQFSPSGPKPAR